MTVITRLGDICVVAAWGVTILMPDRSAVMHPRVGSPSTNTAQFQHPPVPQVDASLAQPHPEDVSAMKPNCSRALETDI